MADEDLKSAEDGESDVNKPQIPHNWGVLFLGLAIITCIAALAAVVLKQYLDARPVNLLRITQDSANEIDNILAYNRVPSGNIKKSEPLLTINMEAKWYSFEYNVDMPSDLSTQGMAQVIKDSMRAMYVDTISTPILNNGINLSFSIGSIEFGSVNLMEPSLKQAMDSGSDSKPMVETPEKELEPPPLEKLPSDSPDVEELSTQMPTETEPTDVEKPRLTIIIDDGGYGGDATEAILALSPALTLSILPNINQSKAIANRAAQLGFEVLLHMPMESKGGNNIFPGQIETSMSDEEIISLTESAILQIQGLKGINNHTGSRFMADEKKLTVFMKTIAKHELFFIDSICDSDSIGFRLAKEQGIPTARRHVFLDNQKNVDYIRGQFEELFKVTEEYGRAIGICHFHKTTAKVLEEMISEIERRKIKLVHASELVR